MEERAAKDGEKKKGGKPVADSLLKPLPIKGKRFETDLWKNPVDTKKRSDEEFKPAKLSLLKKVTGWAVVRVDTNEELGRSSSQAIAELLADAIRGLSEPSPFAGELHRAG